MHRHTEGVMESLRASFLELKRSNYIQSRYECALRADHLDCLPACVADVQ